MRPVRTLAALLLSGLVACGSSSDETPTAPPSPKPLGVVEAPWNPSNLDVGVVQAVVEHDGALTLFGGSGVTTLTAGAIVASDPSITAWRTAATIPSPDGLSSWLVGVDGGGRLQRIEGTRAPADVSDRYGLGGDKVVALAGDGAEAVFQLESGFAVTDGSKVKHYATTARAIAAGAGRVAIVDDGAVRVFDHGAERDVALPDARAIAYDAKGRLLASTAHRLFLIGDGAPIVVFDAGPRTIVGLAAAGDAVWLGVDRDLGRYASSVVAVAERTGLPDATRLVGAPDGSVWALADGKLRRFGAAGEGGADDEATWSRTVQPVYAAVCSNCHSPKGTGKDKSNVDLSSYEAWKTRRETIYDLVVTQSVMPPPDSGYVLTTEQRAAIEAWAKP